MTSIGKYRSLQAAFSAFILCTLASPASAQLEVNPRVAAVGPESDVPVAIQNARWAMLEGDLNTLTFRSMETLFPTRSVPRAGPVSPLPRDDHVLDFTYSVDGESYTPAEFLDRTYTNAMLIMKDGKVVYENYRNNSGPETRFIGWSMTKSFTSVLIGCALAEGRIDSLDDEITKYLPALESGAYDGVTIRQILAMRSGVDYDERYDFENPGIAARNHILALIKNVARFTEPAKTIDRAHDPGEVFQYKTLDTAVLGWLLERVSGGSAIAAYMAQRLWEPLGAERDGFFIMDGPPNEGREFNGAGFNATLRDFARFGLMMLNDGQIDGRRIVSEAWVEQSTQPVGSEDGPRGGYGYHWWTMPDSPAYAAIGLQGQYIYIDPATETVIVKLSHFPPGEQGADQESLAFFKAASEWEPDQ